MKITKREVQANYKTIQVPYCMLQELFSREAPAAHTEGIYGWNADIYTFGSVAFVTGYRPFGEIKPEYITLIEWERSARELKASWRDRNIWDYGTQKDELRRLIDSFIREATTCSYIF